MHMNVGLRVRANIHVLRVFIRRHLCKFALSWCLVRLFVIQVPSDSIVNSAMTRVFDKYYSKAKAPPLVTKMARMLPEATIALCKSLTGSQVVPVLSDDYAEDLEVRSVSAVSS